MCDSALLMSVLWKWLYNFSGINSLPLSFDVSCACWNLCKSVLKSLSMTSSVLLPIKISTGSLFVYIMQVSSKLLVEMQLFCIVSWIFHSAQLMSSLSSSFDSPFDSSFDSPIGLCSFIKSPKYGLITLRYYLGDKCSYLSPLLLYSM